MDSSRPNLKRAGELMRRSYRRVKRFPGKERDIKDGTKENPNDVISEEALRKLMSPRISSVCKMNRATKKKILSDKTLTQVRSSVTLSFADVEEIDKDEIFKDMDDSIYLPAWVTFTFPEVVPPYDPKINYLAPRPQFLHYRPIPRLQCKRLEELSSQQQEEESVVDTENGGVQTDCVEEQRENDQKNMEYDGHVTVSRSVQNDDKIMQESADGNVDLDDESGICGGEVEDWKQVLLNNLKKVVSTLMLMLAAAFLLAFKKPKPVVQEDGLPTTIPHGKEHAPVENLVKEKVSSLNFQQEDKEEDRKGEEASSFPSEMTLCFRKDKSLRCCSNRGELKEYQGGGARKSNHSGESRASSLNFQQEEKEGDRKGEEASSFPSELTLSFRKDKSLRCCSNRDELKEYQGGGARKSSHSGEPGTSIGSSLSYGSFTTHDDKVQLRRSYRIRNIQPSG